MKHVLTFLVSIFLLINGANAHDRIADGKTISKRAWVCSDMDAVNFYIRDRDKWREKNGPVLSKEWFTKWKSYDCRMSLPKYSEGKAYGESFMIKKILFEVDSLPMKMSGSTGLYHYWILDTDKGYVIVWSRKDEQYIWRSGRGCPDNLLSCW